MLRINNTGVTFTKDFYDPLTVRPINTYELVQYSNHNPKLKAILAKESPEFKNYLLQNFTPSGNFIPGHEAMEILRTKKPQFYNELLKVQDTFRDNWVGFNAEQWVLSHQTPAALPPTADISMPDLFPQEMSFFPSINWTPELTLNVTQIALFLVVFGYFCFVYYSKK